MVLSEFLSSPKKLANLIANSYLLTLSEPQILKIPFAFLFINFIIILLRSIAEIGVKKQSVKPFILLPLFNSSQIKSVNDFLHFVPLPKKLVQLSKNLCFP